jgi:hypothetical protein
MAQTAQGNHPEVNQWWFQPFQSFKSFKPFKHLREPGEVTELQASRAS